MDNPPYFEGIAILLGDDGPWKRGRVARYQLEGVHIRDHGRAAVGMHPERARRVFMAAARQMLIDADRTGTMRRELWVTHDYPVLAAYQDMIHLKNRAITYFDDADWREEARWLCSYENVLLVRPEGVIRSTDAFDPAWLGSFRLESLYVRGQLYTLDDGDMPWCEICAHRHRARCCDAVPTGL